MNTALWVIWFALLVAVGFTAFEFGGFFPAGVVTRRIRQEGWDEGFDRGFPHGIRADGGDPDDLAGDEQWDDTVEDLMQRGRSYYEPLARGADGPLSGTTFASATTAPSSGGRTLPPMGDSPGPGLPPSLIFDELAATWPAYEPSAPAPVAGPPPGDRVAGAEPEPPAPDHRDSDTESQAGPGAGADPWQDITASLDEDPDLNQWSINAERARCHEIVRELRQLGAALSGPYQLTPWKGAPA